MTATLIADHGFTVYEVPDQVPAVFQPCRYSDPLDLHAVSTGSEWFCELIGNPDRVEHGGPVPRPVTKTSWEWSNCGCSWCLLRRAGFYDQRGDREVCFLDECQRRRTADERARNRDRLRGRQRDLAADFLAEYPDLSDRQIAALVDREEPGKCARVRVKEARELLAA